MAPDSVWVPVPAMVTLPAPEITPESVPLALALLTLKVSAPLWARLPAPLMPPAPAAVSVNPLPAPESVMPALRMIPPAALSVSVVLALQLTALATVMLPVSLPLAPVVTVTLPVASAFCSVVVLIEAPVAVGTKPVSLLSLEPMVTFHGSSSKLPVLPCWLSRLVVPL